MPSRDELVLRDVTRYAPRLHRRIVDRRRLTVRPGVLDASVIIVRAPGGAGKTTLGRQLINYRGIRGGVWVTVEEHIASRASFWRFVMSRLLGDSSAGVFGGGGFDEHLLLETFLEVGQPLQVVVDDAHLVADDRVFEDLRMLVECVEGFNLILLTRAGLPVFEEAITRARLAPEILDAEDLSFTPEEAGTLGLPTDGVEQALHLTGGNALLLTLVSNAERTHGSVDPRDERLDVYTFAAEQLAKLDVEQRDFLERISVADQFSIDDAAAVTGMDDVSSRVDEVEKLGYVVRTTEWGEVRFRFHPIVRQVLLRRFRARDAKAEVHIHAILAARDMRRGDVFGAFRHGVRGRDYALAVDALIVGGTRILSTGGGDDALAVPHRVLLSHPLLAAARALVENARGQRWDAWRHFAMAVGAARVQKASAPAERASLVVIESTVYRLAGRSASSVRAARRAVRLIEKCGEEVFGEQIRELYVQCGISFFRGGELGAIGAMVERIPLDSSNGGLLAGSLSAAVAAIKCDWECFDEIAARIEAQGWPDSVRNSYRGCLLHFGQMLEEIASGRPQDVAGHFVAVREGSRFEQLEFRPLLVAAAALGEVLSGTRAEGVRALRELEEMPRESDGRSPSEVQFSVAVIGLLEVADGRLNRARRLFGELGDNAWKRVLCAFSALMCGDEPAAARELSMLARRPSCDTPHRSAELILTCWSALLNGESDRADRALEEFLLHQSSHSGSAVAISLLPQSIRDRLRTLPVSLRDDGALSGLFASLPPVFVAQDLHPRLTKREAVVMRELQVGGTNSEIAHRLHISPNTLKTQLRSAYRKLDVSTREEALDRLHELGMNS